MWESRPAASLFGSGNDNKVGEGGNTQCVSPRVIWCSFWLPLSLARMDWTRASTPDSVDAPTLLTLREPVHQLDALAREPMLVEHPDGTLFVTGYEGRNESPDLWKSGDGGATWERVDVGSPADGAVGNSCVDLAVAPDGTLYFITMGFIADKMEGTHVTVGVSHDVGASWTWTYLSQDQYDDRPWVEVAPDGTAHAIWNDGAGVSYAVSTDGGRSWTERERIHPQGGSSHLAIGRSGELAVRVTPLSASGNQYDEGVDLIAVSTDGGKSWQKEAPPGTREWDPTFETPGQDTPMGRARRVGQRRCPLPSVERRTGPVVGSLRRPGQDLEQLAGRPR